MQAASRQAGRRVIDQLRPAFQLRLSATNCGLGRCSGRAFDHQHALVANGIFRLIPLPFLVADEAPLVIPVGRARRAIGVEFVGPDQLPRFGGEGRRLGRGAKTGTIGFSFSLSGCRDGRCLIVCQSPSLHKRARGRLGGGRDRPTSIAWGIRPLNFDLQAGTDMAIDLDLPTEIFEANRDSDRDRCYFALPRLYAAMAKGVMVIAVRPLMPLPFKYRVLNSTTGPF